MNDCLKTFNIKDFLFLDGVYIAVAFSDLIIMNMLIAGTQGP